MKKIIEYKIVEQKFMPIASEAGTNGIEIVEKEVNKLIKQGWQPLGGEYKHIIMKNMMLIEIGHLKPQQLFKYL